MAFQRIDISPEAEAFVAQITADHGPVMFHQSGGCCDGSTPMCYPKGEFRTGGSDVWMGRLAGCDFFMSSDQFEYWKHTHLTLDVTEGRGSSFSLDIPYGKRFLIKSRMLTQAELENLAPVFPGDKVPEP